MYMESHAENNNITIKFSFQKFFNELQIPGCMKVYQVQYAFYNYSNSSQINKIFFWVALSWPTLSDPMHYTAHGILQARTLKWVVIPFSRGSSQHKFEKDQQQGIMQAFVCVFRIFLLFLVAI